MKRKLICDFLSSFFFHVLCVSIATTSYAQEVSKIEKISEIKILNKVEENKPSGLLPVQSYSSEAAVNSETKSICRLVEGKGESGLQFCPVPVRRGNSFDSYDMNTGVGYKAHEDADYLAVRVDPGKDLGPVQAYNKCYYLSNESDQVYFVPFRSEEEWNSFLDQPPSRVVLSPCSIHGVYISNVATSKGHHAVFSLPSHAKGGTVVALSQPFGYLDREQCNDEETLCTETKAWQEVIHATFQATPPRWVVISESFSSNLPEGLPSD